MTTWLVILAVGAGSYAFRALPVLLDGRWSRSARFEQTIGYAGTAALAALVATGFRGSATSATTTVAVAAAAAVAVVVSVRSRSMYAILLAGASVYAAVMAGAWLLG
jgi:branched-subunit amino acid transport protein